MHEVRRRPPAQRTQTFWRKRPFRELPFTLESERLAALESWWRMAPSLNDSAVRALLYRLDSGTFLPLTAVQVLINNLLYDLSQTGIPFDRADPPLLRRPHGWDMRALVRFTLIMGPLLLLIVLFGRGGIMGMLGGRRDG